MVYLYSTTKMMHGPINIRYPKTYLGLPVMQVYDKSRMAALVIPNICHVLPNHSSFITKKAYIQCKSHDRVMIKEMLFKNPLKFH